MHVNLSSLRVRVLVGVAVVSCTVLALFGWRAYTELDYRLDAARVRVQRHAELFAAAQRGFLDHASAVIFGLLRSDEVAAFVPSTMCVRELERAQLESPQFRTIEVALPSGRVICSALPTGAAADIGDRPSFRRALLTSELVVGGAWLDSATRAVTLPLYQAVLTADGHAQGVIVVGVDLASIAHEFVSTKLPEGTRFGIVDASGHLLVRTPDPEGLTGDDRSNSPVFHRMQAQGGSGWLEGVGADGVLRIFGFAPLVTTDAGPLTLWVGIPSALVVNEVTRDFVLPLLVTFVLALVLMVAAIAESDRLFVRPVLALSNAARRLAAGDLTTRVQLQDRQSELGQLGRSLNAMARALQADRQQLDRTHQALRRLNDVFERIPAVMAYVDCAMRIQFANRAAAEWAGVEPERIAGMTVSELLGPDGFAKARPFIESTLGGELERYALTFADTGSVIRHVDVVNIPDRRTHSVTGFFLIANDVTDSKNYQASLAQMAHVDAVTALPNRRAFEELLTQAHKRAQRNDTWVAVLFLDIDEFKSINDTYGHRTGDAVLQAFGAKLRGAVRDADVVARFGGDEFTILLDDLKSPEAIQTVVTKIESSLEVPTEVGAYQLTLRASIGAATARGAETVPEKLLAEADSSMYQAKNRRRPGLLKPQTSEAALRKVAEEAANGDIARNPSSRH